MSLTRVLRLLLAKRDLDRRLRARKAIRSIRSKSAHKGVRTQISNRAAQHNQTWRIS